MSKAQTWHGGSDWPCQYSGLGGCDKVGTASEERLCGRKSLHVGTRCDVMYEAAAMWDLNLYGRAS